MGKLLVVFGLMIALVGVALWSGLGGNWLGRLPGDIRIEREHTGFYFPIVTCIILSLVVSLLLSISRRQRLLDEHVAALVQCRRCPRMLPPPVSGGAILSKVLLVGQAPGVKEPVLARPFAWTAGRTLFGWFDEFCGMNETEVRARIYFAAVCRCFPGKTSVGGDRIPAPDEIRNCASWMNDEMEILRPDLVIPVGKLAIGQFMAVEKLDQIIGQAFPMRRNRHAFDLIPLPHPSGASPWHRIPPGKALLQKAMRLIARHPALKSLTQRAQR